MIDPSNNNYNNGMKDQFLGKMYQIVSMFGVRKKRSQKTNENWYFVLKIVLTCDREKPVENFFCVFSSFLWLSLFVQSKSYIVLNHVINKLFVVSNFVTFA